jgi:class 3 adenylate cyclase
MNCPNCRSENPANAKFCLNCGVPLKHQCANCKTDLPAGARFCMNCGQPVNVTTTTDDARLTRLTAATPAPLASKIRAAHLAGERKIVTAVFADVVGSTAMAEKMDPDDWTTIMNRAFDRISPTIYKYEGTIARLMGDAILAFFGAPVAHEDDPVRAIRASLDLLQAAKEYAEEAKRTYGIDFAMRVGLNTGPVVVGEVGSDLKYEYTAMGDAINLAARMQSAAKPMTVLISEHAYKFVAPIFDFNDLGDIAAYQSLSDLARQRGDQALELAALMERVPLHATPTPLQDAALSHQLLQQALDLAHDIGDRSAEAKINGNLMMTELFGGEIDRAVQYGEQSLAIAREYDLRDQLPFTLNDLAFTYIFHGQMQRGLAAMQEVQELWRAQHNLPMLADSLANAAVSHFYTGHFDRALALGREGARISESINNVWGQSHTYGMLGYTLQEIGHFGEALQLWIASVETGERSGLLATRVGIRSDLGWLYYLLGRIDLAIEQMQRAV